MRLSLLLTFTSCQDFWIELPLSRTVAYNLYSIFQGMSGKKYSKTARTEEGKNTVSVPMLSTNIQFKAILHQEVLF